MQTLTCVSIDIRIDAFCDSILNCELSDGVFQQAARDVIPPAPHQVLPQQVSLKDVLLQDMQFGQSHPEPGLEADAGPGQMGPCTRLTLPQLHQACPRYHSLQ